MAPENDDLLVCPNCQNVNEPGAENCAECGFALIDDPTVPDNQLDDDLEDGSSVDGPGPGIDAMKRSAERSGLIRSVPFTVDQQDGLTFEGYAAVYNDPTMIDSWEGTFRETMKRGAFAKTISERTPVMMFDHGHHPMIGTMPIGVITSLREDDHGLRVQGRLADNWLIEPVRDAIASKAVDGMSFRMDVIKDTWKLGADKIPERTISEVRCPELGPVVFPAYANTEASVRSRQLATALADPETRAELARIFASGTDLSAAMNTDEPVDDHSARTTQLRRRARVLLANV